MMKAVLRKYLFMNAHLPHLEELAFLDLDRLEKLLINEPKISHKIDGAPAVIIGPGFVSTKAYFNKEPRIYQRDADFEQIKNPIVRQKLKTLYQNIPDDLDGIYMGDFLFEKQDLIEDSEEVSFSPNMIQYSTKRDSEEYARIREAEVGVVFHSKIEDTQIIYHQIPEFDSKKIYRFDPRISKTYQLESIPRTEIGTLRYAAKRLKKSELNSINRLALKYFNHKIRRLEYDKSPTDFLRWIQQTEPKKAKLFSKTRYYTIKAFDLYQTIENLKYQAMEQLSNESIPLSASYDGEGFVISVQNQPAKLVDRYSFSSFNLNNAKFVPHDVMFCFGRFNPPTKAHQKLFSILEAGPNGILFTSQTHDYENNPLQYHKKIDYIKTISPNLEIVQDPGIKTVYDALNYLYQQGYQKPKLLVGDDRSQDFREMQIPLQIIPRDDVSATKMREAARRNDFETFFKMAPDLDRDKLSQLFRELK